jgi:hypothetical protein
MTSTVVQTRRMDKDELFTPYVTYTCSLNGLPAAGDAGDKYEQQSSTTSGTTQLHGLMGKTERGNRT